MNNINELRTLTVADFEKILFAQGCGSATPENHPETDERVSNARRELSNRVAVFFYTGKQNDLVLSVFLLEACAALELDPALFGSLVPSVAPLSTSMETRSTAKKAWLLNWLGSLMRQKFFAAQIIEMKPAQENPLLSGGKRDGSAGDQGLRNSSQIEVKVLH